MKTYLATVCLTKTYTDKMCNQVLLQKEFPDEKAAHAWLNKALERYNYVAGIKGLCYVSWFSLDDENGTQLLYIIGKTKCDGIQNQMRLFGGRVSPKRKATKISHTHTKKHRSNGF